MNRFPLSLSLTLALLMSLTGVMFAQSVEEQARADVDYLASFAARGRGYLLNGDDAAAAYISGQFRRLGLDSLSDGYYQPFTLQLNEQAALPYIRINGKNLQIGRDFLPDERTGSGEVSSPVKIVYAGSGLLIPDKKIDDYKGKEVTGQIVVIDEAVPDKVMKDTTINPQAWSYDYRIQVASMMGARAVIVRADRLTYGEYGVLAIVPVFRVLKKTFPKNIKTISMFASSSFQEFQTQNVVAKLPGTLYPDSTIILTAHYDHLGSLGDTTYFPGANDNASGVAMLLAMARYFKAHPLKYSMVFIAFSGEEAGLVGSRHFVESPLVDLGKGRFVLNMDMTASGKEGVMAVGGVEFPQEFEILNGVATSLGIKDVRKRENAPNSDHYYFVRAGMRGFYVYPFTGRQPYHSLEDKPKTLQWDVFDRLYDLLRGFLEKLG
jgi:hypothetical protein